MNTGKYTNTDKYFKKYLKYKNKYLMKKFVGGSYNSGNELKILVIVDVQNCFINGGSMGGDSLMNSIKQMYEIEKLIDENTLIIFSRDFHPLGHTSFKVHDENNKVIEGYFEPHCRNSKNKCQTKHDDKIKEIDTSIKLKDVYKSVITKLFSMLPNYYEIIDNLIDSLIEQIIINKNIPILQRILTISKQLENENYDENSDCEILQQIMNAWEAMPQINMNMNIFINNILSLLFIKTISIRKIHLDADILGTQLSYLFLASKYRDIVYMLNQNNNNKIGLCNNQNIDQRQSIGTNLLKDINYNVEPIQYNDKYFVQITKGEYCNYESYSAFNYHLNYSNGFSSDDNTKLPCNKKYSTGLCEFIDNFIKQNDEYTNCKPVITVCGLVGNICVMNTVHQGIIMTKFYETLKNAEFIYSALGTLWLLPYTDNLSKANNIMIKDSDDYNKEIEFFQKDIIDVLKINGNGNMKYNIILSDNKHVKLNYANSRLQITNI